MRCALALAVRRSNGSDVRGIQRGAASHVVAAVPPCDPTAVVPGGLTAMGSQPASDVRSVNPMADSDVAIVSRGDTAAENSRSRHLNPTSAHLTP
jgi:hypothetical protein